MELANLQKTFKIFIESNFLTLLWVKWMIILHENILHSMLANQKQVLIIVFKGPQELRVVEALLLFHIHSNQVT